ncbi:MAG TPA: ABC-2 family transporter protein [Thermotogota bacterium]|nr:ABC-2 family transporter protein [Thermotogota bacterium]
MGNLRAFWSLLRASLRTQTEYRVNFIVSIVINAGYTAADFLLLSFLILRFKELGGWNIAELALLYSVVETGTGFFKLFGYGFEHFEYQMVTGRFDLILIRPVSPLILLFLQKVDFRRIANVGQALAIGIYGVLNVHSCHTFLPVWVFILAICSFLLQAEINWILASVAFWTIKNEELHVLAYYSMRTAAIYPLSIFETFFKHLLTYIIPLGTVGYFPLLYLFGKTGNRWALFSPFISILLLFPVCLCLWKCGIRHYTSTGT